MSQGPDPSGDAQPGPNGSPLGPADAPRSSLLGGFFRGIRDAGREVVSVALGKLLSRDEALGDQAAADQAAQQAEQAAIERQEDAEAFAARRVGLLHQVAEQLRGAADTYIAAKLDEIEARVDTKLNAIEARIDRKIVELHQQFADLRDRELRHRLRLLKLTLIFTVLVALVSLAYKWLAHVL